jgi:hypothetical protein
MIRDLRTTPASDRLPVSSADKDGRVSAALLLCVQYEYRPAICRLKTSLNLFNFAALLVQRSDNEELSSSAGLSHSMRREFEKKRRKRKVRKKVKEKG